MRLARVMIARSIDDDDVPLPPARLAIVRDGSAYDVEELERVFDTAYAPDRFACSSDFHTRVAALRCAGLDELDARLASGRRPASARFEDGSFTILPPCDQERALFVQGVGGARGPRYRIGSARQLREHATSIASPKSEGSARVELAIAALLGEDLSCATKDEASRAIVGYAIQATWVAPSIDASGDVTRARDFGPQLGPWLVTKNEVGALDSLATRVSLGDRRVDGPRLGSLSFTLAETIACASEHLDLRAGDVVASAPLRFEALDDLAFDEPVEVSIERLGKLSGRPVRG